MFSHFTVKLVHFLYQLYSETCGFINCMQKPFTLWAGLALCRVSALLQKVLRDAGWGLWGSAVLTDTVVLPGLAFHTGLEEVVPVCPACAGTPVLPRVLLLRVVTLQQFRCCEHRVSLPAVCLLSLPKHLHSQE